jgi:hypothetical protein
MAENSPPLNGAMPTDTEFDAEVDAYDADDVLDEDAPPEPLSNPLRRTSFPPNYTILSRPWRVIYTSMRPLPASVSFAQGPQTPSQAH